MSGVNRVTILGHLGRDPELRYLQSGAAVCKLNIATSRRYKNTHGEEVEETEWHRVSVWGKHAENCNNFLTKGRQVYVEGRLRTSSYDKDGQKHYTTEIVAESVQFIGGRPDGERQGQQGQGQQREGQGQQRQGQQRQGQQRQGQQRQGGVRQGGKSESPRSESPRSESSRGTYPEPGGEYPDFTGDPPEFGGNPGDDDIPF